MSHSPPPTDDLCSHALAVLVADARRQVVAADTEASGWVNRGVIAVCVDEVFGELFADSQVAAAFENVIAGSPFAVVESRLRTPVAAGAAVCVHLRRLEGASGPLALIEIHAIGVAQNVTAAHALDAVTALPDRRALADRIQSWNHESGGATPFAVLFLDLDDFKHVNDVHGHPTGDVVLRELAARWSGCIRDGDLVARYGGDEFVVLVQGVTDRAEVEPVIRRLRDATQRPVDLGELQLHVHATVGAALPPGDGTTLEELIAAADRDMYARKRRPRADESP